MPDNGRVNPRLLLPLAALTVLTACSDDPNLQGGPLPASPSSDICRPANDQTAFAVYPGFKPPAAKLRRPFAVTVGEKIYLSADILTAAGAVHAPAAVWVSGDVKGTKLAALDEAAKANTTFPDAATTYDASPDDAAAKRAQECVRTG